MHARNFNNAKIFKMRKKSAENSTARKILEFCTKFSLSLKQTVSATFY